MIKLEIRVDDSSPSGRIAASLVQNSMFSIDPISVYFEFFDQPTVYCSEWKKLPSCFNFSNDYFFPLLILDLSLKHSASGSFGGYKTYEDRDLSILSASIKCSKSNLLRPQSREICRRSPTSSHGDHVWQLFCSSTKHNMKCRVV